MSTKPVPPGNEWHAYVSDFRSAGHAAVDWIAEYLEHTRDYAITPKVAPGALFDSQPRSAPDAGESFASLMQEFDRTIMPAVVHWNHPAFFGYFACTGSTPAILGEMLAAALNTNGLHWKTSPAVAELEQVTLAWLAEWMGLDPKQWFGIVYDTASTSSMHAIACAREAAMPEARVNGATPGLVLYCSDQAHSSIEKGAIALGIGQKYVRKVPSDTAFRMDAAALEKMIAADLAAGLRPFCVVATVGTTSTASLDPVPAIASLAARHKLWLHVDAAYAGPAAMVPELRHIFDGVERADSLVVNTHKWMLTPIDLSAFYTRRPEILRRAFSLVPEYLRPQDDPRAHNLMDYGVPLGHRFRALKLWFVMRYFGRERIVEMLRNHVAWAQRFAKLVAQSNDFELAAPPSLSVVCFRYVGPAVSAGQSARSAEEFDVMNRAILEAVNATGETFLSSTVLNGKFALHLAIGNLGTTWDDVERAWSLLQRAADQK
jgi:aromatic-L-amino-acid decarboxylase